VFSGGEYDEVARWLRNFVASHAKRENLRAEPVVEAEGAREGQSYGVRVRLGGGLSPRRPHRRSSWASRRWRRTGGASRGARASRPACARSRASCPRPGRARCAPPER